MRLTKYMKHKDSDYKFMCACVRVTERVDDFSFFDYSVHFAFC